jgi:drug/metabolite transporter (DMT)-like permease
MSSTLFGNLFAVLGGIAAGLYILGGKHLRKTLSTTTYVFIVFGTATLALGIVCITFESPLQGITTKSYELLLLMAIVSGIGGHTLYNWALKYVRASVVSVSLLFEPIGASLLAFMLPWLHEIPTSYTLMGGCLIISGLYLTMLEQDNQDAL